MMKIKTISKERLKRMIKKNEDFVLINVLPKEYFEEGHIGGSVNIPLADKDFEKKVLKKISDKSKKIVVYCANYRCQASAGAVEKLKKLGYIDVIDYEGGIHEWKETGYQIFCDPSRPKCTMS